MRGMEKESGTRSGLLWQVERILNECESLPQMLLMENVPQVHGKRNIDDFTKWCEYLKAKGYHNYWQDLNAKDYGIAQNRNRCFMVSLLDDGKYEFPKPIELHKTMRDYLEDEVDASFFVESDRAKKLIEKLEMEKTIEVSRGGYEPIDLSLTETSKKDIANCVSSRTDRGVSARRKEGNGVAYKD